jgi:hypothetical protein
MIRVRERRGVRPPFENAVLANSTGDLRPRQSPVLRLGVFYLLSIAVRKPGVKKIFHWKLDRVMP